MTAFLPTSLRRTRLHPTTNQTARFALQTLTQATHEASLLILLPAVPRLTTTLHYLSAIVAFMVSPGRVSASRSTATVRDAGTRSLVALQRPALVAVRALDLQDQVPTVAGITRSELKRGGRPRTRMTDMRSGRREGGERVCRKVLVVIVLAMLK